MQFLINKLELFFIPKLKSFNKPQPIAPRMIVLRIWVEDLIKELYLFLEVFLMKFHDASAMMPDLKVLLHIGADLIQKL